MGVLFFLRANHNVNMKVLLIVALAVVSTMAEPEAEADPALLYAGYYGYPYHYGYYGYYPHTGAAYNYGWTDGPNNGVGLAYGRKRRDAEEEKVAPVAVAAYQGLPYENGWTDGPNNGVGYAYGVPAYYHVPYYWG